MNINKRQNDIIEIKELEELDLLKDKKIIKQLHLNFAERKFIISGVKKFSKVIHELSEQQKLDQLHTLIIDFSKNEIGSYGCEILVKPMKKLFNIKKLHLNLQWNDITQQGTKYLGFIIGCFENLHDLYLNLWGNDLGNLGIHNLFKGMDLAYKSADIDLDALLNLNLSKSKKTKKSKTLYIADDDQKEELYDRERAQTEQQIPTNSMTQEDNQELEENKVNNEELGQDENDDEEEDVDEEESDEEEYTNDNIQKIEKLYSDDYKLLAIGLTKIQRLALNFKLQQFSLLTKSRVYYFQKLAQGYQIQLQDLQVIVWPTQRALNIQILMYQVIRSAHNLLKNLVNFQK